MDSVKKESSLSDHGHILQKLLLSNHKLALDIYKLLIHDGPERSGNLIFSPISLQIALLMLLSGANGKTAEELKTGLNLRTEEKDELLLGTKLLLESLQNSCLKVASKMFVANKFPVKKSYEQLVKNYFEPIYRNVKFAKFPTETADFINSWVSEKTNNLITDVISPRDLDEYTVMILLNAVYFKAEWSRKFGSMLTENESFHVSPDKCIDIAMMTNPYEYLGYSKQKSFGILEIPYKDGKDLRFFVFLPDEINGLAQVENTLFETEFQEMLREVKRTLVSLKLPKMKIEESVNVKRILGKLGMKVMFNPYCADFFDMFSREEVEDVLYVDDLFHKAVLKVNEDGTEAAGLTYGQLRGGADCAPTDMVDFHVNRPFIFMILQKDSILFMGRVINPQKY
ncbi:serine protease inhibitor 42Dd-like isoform X2 [Planococcus citri]|uniref:serine protease inhibitor 42Dd-like isoform X2 n=1 Tax=Planococcus citri TaxID=170843 RepID=UPI0031F8FF54